MNCQNAPPQSLSFVIKKEQFLSDNYQFIKKESNVSNVSHRMDWGVNSLVTTSNRNVNRRDKMFA